MKFQVLARMLEMFFARLSLFFIFLGEIRFFEVNELLNVFPWIDTFM